jgi:hypothetical protein
MRKLWLVALVGCWSSSSKPASEPQPTATAAAMTRSGAAYGGAEYGGVGYGADAADAADPLAGSQSSAVTVVSGQTSSLDRNIIRRHVRRNIQKIQYCYEQELMSNPSLTGRVDVRFVVGGNGNVVQSTGSGMPPVDACVAQVIAGIQFPAPQGGGVVVVNYPFIFDASSPTP